MSTHRSSSRGRWTRPSLESLEDRLAPAADPLSAFNEIQQVQGALTFVQNNLGALASNPQTAQALGPFLTTAQQLMVADFQQLQAFEQQLPALVSNQFQALIAGNPNLTQAQITAVASSLIQFLNQATTLLNGALNQAVANFTQARQELAAAAGNPGGVVGVTFVGSAAGSAKADSVGVHNLSGTVTFVITGDGSLSNPFGGVMNVQGQDTFVSTFSGVPGSTTGFGAANAPISSNLHQIMATGSGNGFTVSFNGTVSATENNVLGTLTVSIADGFGSSTMIGVFAARQ
jgi:hypothetical protein